jgi:hypothetical protein
VVGSVCFFVGFVRRIDIVENLVDILQDDGFEHSDFLSNFD